MPAWAKAVPAILLAWACESPELPHEREELSPAAVPEPPPLVGAALDLPPYGSAGRDKASFDPRYARAMSILDRNTFSQADLDRAETLARDLLAARPEEPLARVALARVIYKRGYASAGRFDPRALAASRQQLERALQMDPACYEAWLLSGYLHCHAGDLGAAAGVLDRLERLRPASIDGLGLGLYLHQLRKQWRRAIEVSDLVLRTARHPKNRVDALEARALALDGLGWTAEAEQTIRRARELSPDCPGLLHIHAFFLARLGRFDQAIETARESIALADVPDGHMALAGAFACMAGDAAARGDERRAESYYELAAEHALKANASGN